MISMFSGREELLCVKERRREGGLAGTVAVDGSGRTLYGHGAVVRHRLGIGQPLHLLTVDRVGALLARNPLPPMEGAGPPDSGLGRQHRLSGVAGRVCRSD